MGVQDTASKTWLLLECQRPFDHEVETETDEPGEAARYGSAWHDGLALRAEGKKVIPSELAEKHDVEAMEQMMGLGAHIDSAWKHTAAWIEKDDYRIAHVEKPLASRILEGQLFPETREVEFFEESHIYALKPGEFGGTADLLLENPKTRERVVLDYKSGVEVGPDPKTPQLLSLALMTGANAVAVLHYPRNSLPTLFYEKVGVEELQAFSRRRQLAMSRIGDGSLRPGPWCQRCPAREGCPAQHADLFEKTAALALGSETSLASGIDFGKFHQLWGGIEKLVKIAKDEIRERVAAGEIIERPDGKVLTLQEIKPYETVSIGSIREALGKKAESEIAALRTLGAVKQVTPSPRLVAK